MRPRLSSPLATDLAVEQFAQDVGVARMAGRLFEEVHEYPAEVHRGLIRVTRGQLVEAGSESHDVVDPSPGALIDVDGRGNRVSRGDGAVGGLVVLTGETLENPERFGAGHVLQEPEKSGTAGHGRSPGRLLVDSGHLPDERVTLVLEQSMERRPLVDVQARRLLIGHGPIVRARVDASAPVPAMILAMDTLAQLIVRTSTAEDGGTALALFDTVDPVAIAGRIEDFVARRLAPVDHALFYRAGVGAVAGVVLVDGSRVVVKVHRWNVTTERLRAVQRLQDHQAGAGLPAPRPLVAPEPLGQGLAIAEEMIRGGSADGRDGSVRRTIAGGLHDFVSAAGDFAEMSALGSPLMLRNPVEPLWPEPHDVRFDFEATTAGAEWIDELALSARRRLHDLGPDRVAGHFDWRVGNLGFGHGKIVAIYDWDSVSAAPEAVVVGNTAAQFSVDWANGDPDPLPTPAEMDAFVDDYGRARGRGFDRKESDLLDAANLAMCAYGARCQHADRTLYPALGGADDSGWLRLLCQRGERWFGR